MIHLKTPQPDLKSPQILWENVLRDGTLTGSTETADGAAANAVGQSTSDGWVPSVMPATLSVVLSAARLADAAAFVAHTLGSSGSTVYVEYLSGATWITSASVTPATDDPFVIFFPLASSDEWRVRIIGASTPFVGVAIICRRLSVPGTIGVPHTPLNLADDVELLGRSRSRNGHFLGSEVHRSGFAANLNLEVQQKDFILDKFESFRVWFNEGNAFVFCSAPTTLSDDMGYCWRDGRAINPGFKDAVYMNVDLNVRGYRG